MKQTQVLNIFLMITAVTTLTGCGNIFAERSNSPLVRSQFASTGSAQSTGSGSNNTVFENGFNCSYQNTILPNQTNYLGSGEYRICTDPINPNRIQVHGSTFFENSICIYPIQYLDGQGVFLKQDPRQTDQTVPYVDCQDITASGGDTFNFQTTFYNGLIIVEQSLNAEYSKCLIAGDPTACDPNVVKYVSKGRFR